MGGMEDGIIVHSKHMDTNYLISSSSISLSCSFFPPVSVETASGTSFAAPLDAADSLGFTGGSSEALLDDDDDVDEEEEVEGSSFSDFVDSLSAFSCSVLFLSTLGSDAISISYLPGMLDALQACGFLQLFFCSLFLKCCTIYNSFS